MATIPVVKHKQPMKLADGNYHLYPTTIDLVKMPDGETPAFDMEDGWTAANSTHLGGRPAEDYALKGEGGGTGVPAGGSAGQTLVKQSDEDGDAEWATPNLMDAVYSDPEDTTITEEGVILPIVSEDSEKLGGQTPDYYAKQERVDQMSQQMTDYRTAVNLLDNSDFRNPVMPDGLSGEYGSNVSALVRWKASNNTSISQSREGGLLLDSTNGVSYVTQTTNLGDGTYTLVTYDQNGNVGALSVHKIEGTTINRLALSYGKDQSYILMYYKNGPIVQIAVNAGHSGHIYTAAVYSGIFDKNTVPPYASKGYANELIACNIADTGRVHDSDKLGGKPPEYYIQPRNLLDNSNFRNPVMQAGFCRHHGAVMYMVDRWICYPQSAENYGFTAGVGISVAVGSTIFQKIADANILDGNTYTLAIWTSDGSAHCVTLSGAYQVVGNSGYVATHNNENILYIQGNGGTLPIAQVAVFRGSYTAETLPPYAPKGYAVELMECLRYFEVLGEWNYNSYSDLDFTFNHHPKVSTEITRTVVSKTGTQGKIGKYSGGWSDMDVSCDGSASTTRIMAYGGAGMYGFKRLEISADL